MTHDGHACMVQAMERQQAREDAALPGGKARDALEVVRLLCVGTGLDAEELHAYAAASAHVLLMAAGDLDENGPGKDLELLVATWLARVAFTGYHAAQIEHGR